LMRFRKVTACKHRTYIIQQHVRVT
jgi:hypothetical protein